MMTEHGGNSIYPSKAETPDIAKSRASGIELSRTERTVVTAGLMVGMFLSALEATAVSTAMPTVVASLGGLNVYSWVFSAYFLTSTISLPLWGKLSDLYGRRNFYLLGIAIFSVGSALSGQSESMLELIIFRALQGFGGGALITLGMIIIGEIYSLKERARVQGLFGGVWGFSSIVGPIIGGFLTDHLSWRWVFYLNIPFGIAAALVVGFKLKESPRNRSVYLDYRGAILLASAITLALVGLMRIGGGHLSALLMIVLCALLVWLFISTEKKAKDPILPLNLFKDPFFKSSAITGFLVGMAMFGSISFIPLFVQGVIGTTATGTGTVLMPLLLTWVSFSGVSGKLMLSLGYRRLMFLGTFLVAIGFFFLSRMGIDTTQGETIRNMVFLGSGMGMIFVPLVLAVQNSVPKSHFGIATSTTQFFRLVGGAVGVSVMGVVMSAFMERGFSSLPKDALHLNTDFLNNPDMIVDPIARQSLAPEMLDALQGVLAHSLHHVFITGFIIAILAFLSAFLVPKEKVRDRRDEGF